MDAPEPKEDRELMSTTPGPRDSMTPATGRATDADRPFADAQGSDGPGVRNARPVPCRRADATKDCGWWSTAAAPEPEHRNADPAAPRDAARHALGGAKRGTERGPIAAHRRGRARRRDVAEGHRPRRLPAARDPCASRWEVQAGA